MDAAKIINAAARENEFSRLETPSAHALRNPFRNIRIVEIDVPPSTEHPRGHTYYVHPKQVLAHLRRFPGARVVRELRRKVLRRLNPTDVKPVGHGHNYEFLRGREVNGGSS